MFKIEASKYLNGLMPLKIQNFFLTCTVRFSSSNSINFFPKCCLRATVSGSPKSFISDCSVQVLDKHEKHILCKHQKVLSASDINFPVKGYTSFSSKRLFNSCNSWSIEFCRSVCSHSFATSSSISLESPATSFGFYSIYHISKLKQSSIWGASRIQLIASLCDDNRNYLVAES